MRVGVLVDGQAEYYSIKELLGKIPGAPPVTVQYVDIQPNASPGKIVNAAVRFVNTLRNCSRIVVLLDLEQRDECPGVWASALKEELERASTVGCPIDVVIKVRMYENWLVADPHGINAHTRLFQLSAAQIRSIEPNTADHVRDPVALLKAAKRSHESYDKVRDAIRLVKVVNPMTIAQNSRSFRRFLRVLQVPPYTLQSRNPAATPGRAHVAGSVRTTARRRR